MRQRLFKEARLLFPAWLVAWVAPLVPFFLLRQRDAEPVAATLFLIGCTFIGASSLGPEFSHRTMAQLLSQPMSRSRIWIEKMLVLGLSLIPAAVFAGAVFYTLSPAVVFANAVFYSESFDILEKGLMLILPICSALCVTPCLTLLTRSTIGAVVFSLAIPFLLALGGQALAIHLLRRGAFAGFLPPHWTTNEAMFVAYFSLILFGVYCAAFAWLGYSRFKRYQVDETFSEEIAFGKVLEAPFARAMRAGFGKRAGPLWSLRQKELRLQQIPFALALILIVIEACVVGYVRLVHPAESTFYFLAPLIIYIGAIPILTGALSIAEERCLGLHSWQLLQPVSAFKQWVVKVSMVFGVSIVLGVILPGGVLWMGQRFWESGAANQVLPETLQLQVLPETLQPWGRPLLFGAQLMLTALAIYASSVAANTLRAAVLATGLAIGGSIGFGVAIHALRGLTHVVAITYDSRGSIHLESAVVPTLVVMVLFSGLMLLFSYSNFRRVHRSGRELLAQAFCFGGPLGLGILLAAVFFLALL